MGRIIGYVRVSTEEQNLDRQLVAMGEVDKLYQDKMSGKNTNRDGLQQMFKEVRKGDTIRVKSIDRLARSTRDLLAVLDDMENRGVDVEFIDTPYLNTNSKEGRFFVTILGALAEMERKTIHERQAEGIAIAKAQGKYEQTPKLTPEQVAEITRRLDDGEGVSSLAREYGVARCTLYKAFKKEGGYSKEEYADIPAPKHDFQPTRTKYTRAWVSNSKPALTPAQVAEARVRYKNGEKLSALKEEFGTTQVVLAHAVHGASPYDKGDYTIVPAIA